jgi:integrase
MSAGVYVRHMRACGSHAGARCNCRPSYQAAVWDNDAGKLIRKTFPTLSAAKRWRRDAMTDVGRGHLQATADVPAVGVALDELVAGMQDGIVLTRSGTAYKPATIRTYQLAIREVWKPKLGKVRLSDVRRRDVQAVVDELRVAGRKASTIANALDPLRVVFRRAVRSELVTRDPTKELDLPAVRSAPRDIRPADDPDALLAPLKPLERALWATALFAGLRRGELRALRWAEVDFDAGLLRVRRSWDEIEGEQEPKTAASVRDVPLTATLRRELAAWRLRSGRGDGLVFGAGESEPFALSSVDRHAKAAWPNDEGMTLHAARHAYASTLIAAGVSPKAVQTYMGHTSITTTFDLYGHLFPSSVLADVERIDAFHADRAKVARK